MKTFKFKQTRLIAALLTAGVIGGIGAAGIQQLPHAAYAQTTATAAAVPVIQPNMMEVPNFAAIVAREGKAVVNISTSGTEPASEAGEIDPGLRDFLRQFGLPPGAFQFNPPSKKGIPIRGEGSGFIISSNGLILTNAHVVKGATKVTVKLTDRREYTAKVLGMDPKTDIAVVKIDAHDLPTVTFGDSTALRPGDWVLAIGSPFGFENSVTAGIVSAKGRSLPDDSAVPFIQTDVAVNPGNSGGPLFNLQGQVVGINSQIFSTSGGAMGLSFSIPINLAMDAAKQLETKGYVSRGMIGVQIQTMSESVAKARGVANGQGALVAQVQPGGAAAKAGIQIGDVITSFDGHKIYESSDLPPMVAMTAPGTEAAVGVLRNGKPMTIRVKVAEMPRNGLSQQLLANSPAATAGGGLLGLTVQDLTPAMRQQLGSTAHGGVVVTGVKGAAADAGLQPGDVVLRVGNAAVDSVAEFRRATASVKHGSTVLLLVSRNGANQFVAISVPAK